MNSDQMSYAGPLPLSSRTRVEQAADKLLPGATLRLVQATKWALYGDSGTRKITGIKIDAWLFAFVKDSKGVVLVLSGDSINQQEFKGVIEYAQRLPPLGQCKIEIDAAVRIAASKGNREQSGPKLNMFNVTSHPAPVWVMPGMVPVRINAQTGDVVDPQQLSEIK